MADSNLDIAINTKANLAGVKDAQVALENLTGSAKDVGTSMGVISVTSDDVAKATAKTTAATGHETMAKRELREIIRKLTADYPLLGEAARFALDPMVLAVAGPIIAWEIFQKRVEAVVAVLGEVAMPDLLGGIEQAKMLGEHWHGIAEAVAAANREFNSSESIYNRTKDALDKQADAEKKLLEVHKAQALANLELHKGTMPDAQYKLNQAGIENYYAQQSAGIDQYTADQHLATRRAEKMSADLTAQQKAKAAAAIPLPDNKEVFDAQQAALKTRADTLNQNLAKVQTQMDFISTLSVDGNYINNTFDAYKFHGTYGNDQTVSGAMAIETRNHRYYSDSEKAVRAEIARREREFARKTELQNEASASAKLGTDLGNSLPVEQKDHDFQARTAGAVLAGQQQVNVTKAVAEITAGGADVKDALADLGAAYRNGMTGIVKAAQDQQRLVNQDILTRLSRVEANTNLH